ncbi:MAG: coenzyme F420-0:L-glutamate ligase [Candidatus Daviesbacteria bacterium]
MVIKAIKTRKFYPPKDNLQSLLKGSIKTIKENSIVVIASKVVSIGEGRCFESDKVKDKDELIIKESDMYLPRKYVPEQRIIHTLSKGIFVPTAGIDESNGNDYLILWPKDPEKSAQNIWKFLRAEFKIKNLGIIISDSHSSPLRRGLTGFALSFFGFNPLKDYRGNPDIFGREMKVSMTNLPDSLAAAAVAVMGEGDECTPIAIIEDIPQIEFMEKKYQPKKPYSSFIVPLEEDLFKPFLSSVPWKKVDKET